MQDELLMVSRFFDPSSTSSVWLDGLRRIDPDAWEKLTVVYAPLVFQLAKRRGLQESDAADVTQDVFRKTLAAIERYDADRPSFRFRKWFVTIAMNAIRDFQRSRCRAPLVVDGSAGEELIRRVAQHVVSRSDSGSVPEAATVPDEPDSRPSGYDPDALGFSERDLLRSALEAIRDQVDPVHWNIFEQRILSGLSVAEIAEESNVSEANVYKICQRIMKRFRNEYGELFADSTGF